MLDFQLVSKKAKQFWNSMGNFFLLFFWNQKGLRNKSVLFIWRELWFIVTLCTVGLPVITLDSQDRRILPPDKSANKRKKSCHVPFVSLNQQRLIAIYIKLLSMFWWCAFTLVSSFGWLNAADIPTWWLDSFGWSCYRALIVIMVPLFPFTLIAAMLVERWLLCVTEPHLVVDLVALLHRWTAEAIVFLCMTSK